MSGVVLSETLRALGGVEPFLDAAVQTGRALVPSAPTRELAIVAAAAIAGAQGRPVRVVADPDVLPHLARRVSELGVVVDHWVTPARFAATSDQQDTAVLVVINETPKETSRAGRAVVAAVAAAADAGRVVVRRAVAGNPLAQGLVAAYPHAVYVPARGGVPTPRRL